jgi:hypothetical protein
MSAVLEMARKGDKRKAVWSAAEAESESASDSSADNSSGSELTESENEDTELPCVGITIPDTFVVFGKNTPSQYDTVMSGPREPASSVQFPLTDVLAYTVVSYTTVHSPKRQTIHRARAVTVSGANGGRVHHVIESNELEIKAITALFAAKQVSDVDISKRVLTKNSARHAKTADRFNLWKIMESKNRDSYKTLMVKGFGLEPTLVFATFYSDHLIAATADDVVRPSKKQKVIEPPVESIVAPTPPIDPVVCQNMVWNADLEALFARAPAGVEKRFIAAFFKMIKA